VTNNGPNCKRTVTVRRKATKRTLPFDLTEGELELVSLPPPQDEDIPARKRPRLEEPLPTTTDEATRETASPVVSEGHSLPAADNDDANANLATDTQPNAGAAPRATGGGWTLEEDAKLTRAVANTSKKKRGKEYVTNWAAVATLVPNRTKIQCWSRWNNTFNPSNARV
jgi:hypothetical protein